MPSDSQERYITFICSGNTCRSPMAERLFKHATKGEKGGFETLTSISAGVAAYEGSPPSTNSVKALKDCGISLEGHHSKQLTQEIINKSLVLFCMTNTHKGILEAEYNLDNKPLFLMRELMTEARNKEIPDPFGQSYDVYQECRDRMVEAIPSIIKYIKKEFFSNEN